MDIAKVAVGSMTTDNPTLRAALTYTGRGWHVFPIKPNDKIPATPNGVLDATTDGAKITEWFGNGSAFNIAIATGRSGLVVLDLDGPEGEATLARLAAEQGVLPDTPEALTPGGGRHLLFSDDGQPVRPRTNVFGKGSKVDVRSGESYIVVAPSIHPNGGKYRWAKGKTAKDIAAPSLPEWIRERLTDPEPRAAAPDDDGELIEDGQDEYGARRAARLARQGYSQDEARAALEAMIEHRFAGGWAGLDPRRPWDAKDVDRWIRGAYEKFYDPNGSDSTDTEAIAELMAQVQAPAAPATAEVTQRAITPTDPFRAVEGFSAAELQGEHFEPINWVIGDLLPEGASILGGKPKVGKSWLTLGLAAAVASESDYALGELTVSRGEVLYLALEDGKRRLQRRLRKLLGESKRWPKRLQFYTEWPRVDKGGIEAIDKWLDEHPTTQLVVIDTLKHIEPSELTKSNGGYRADYASITPLQHLAQRRGIAILIVTHLRKLGSDDPIDQLQGTLGLSGGIDNFYVFTRPKGSLKGTLYYRGRDVDEGEKALVWREGDSMLWRIDNEPDDKPKAGDAVLESIRPGETVSPKELADRLGLPADTVRKRLERLADFGQVVRLKKDTYALSTTALLDV